MLESLLIFIALAGNQESFNKSTEAYYKYQKLDVIAEKIGREYPILAQTVSAIGLVRNKKVYFQAVGPWFYEARLNGTDATNIAWFKKEF